LYYTGVPISFTDSIRPSSNYFGHLSALLQCLWRCYAAEPRSNLIATWKIHMMDTSHSHGHLFSRVARRASASLTRRRRTVYQKHQSIDTAAASSPAGGPTDGLGHGYSGGGSRERKDSVDSVIIYNGRFGVS